MTDKTKKSNLYTAVMEKIFFDKYKKGSTSLEFDRSEILSAAKKLGLPAPKNLGDVIYSLRYRVATPAKIAATEPKGMHWTIEGIGQAKYAFKLSRINRIVPNTELLAVKIPDSTPEIVAAYALSDEQALLAKLRYNRLLDIFLGITTYSLQSHMRTTVKNVGQIEIDEMYVGVDSNGRQFIIPVQAKGGSDKLSVIQTKQDIASCKEKFPDLVCRSISAQFTSDGTIALFELAVEAATGDVKISEEKHYKLVPSDQISSEDLRNYSFRK
jgi:hypothetical protein